MSKLNEHAALLQFLSNEQIERTYYFVSEGYYIMLLTVLTGEIILYTRIGLLIVVLLVLTTILGRYYWQVKKVNLQIYLLGTTAWFIFRAIITFCFFYDEEKRNVVFTHNLIHLILYPELGYYRLYRLFGPIEMFVLFLAIGSFFWMSPLLLVGGKLSNFYGKRGNQSNLR